jgi:hypothetical protein
MALWVAGWVAEPGLGSTLTQKIVTVVVWYAVSCIPVWMAGYLYSRQRRKAGPLRALLLGHLLLVGNYITYVACWRGFFRLVVGANSWQKTDRHRERSHRAGRRRRIADRPLVAPAAGAVASATLVASAIRPLAVPAQRRLAEGEWLNRTGWSDRPSLDQAEPTQELVGVLIAPDRGSSRAVEIPPGRGAPGARHRAERGGSRSGQRAPAGRR